MRKSEHFRNVEWLLQFHLTRCAGCGTYKQFNGKESRKSRKVRAQLNTTMYPVALECSLDGRIGRSVLALVPAERDNDKEGGDVVHVGGVDGGGRAGKGDRTEARKGEASI